MRLVCHIKEMAAGDVRVDRQTPHGNPYAFGKLCAKCGEVHRKGDMRILWCYQRYLAVRLRQPDALMSLGPLAGKRLACWCSPSGRPGPCHADILVVGVRSPGLLLSATASGDVVGACHSPTCDSNYRFPAFTLIPCLHDGQAYTQIRSLFLCDECRAPGAHDRGKRQGHGATRVDREAHRKHRADGPTNWPRAGEAIEATARIAGMDRGSQDPRA